VQGSAVAYRERRRAVDAECARIVPVETVGIDQDVIAAIELNRVIVAAVVAFLESKHPQDNICHPTADEESVPRSDLNVRGADVGTDCGIDVDHRVRLVHEKCSWSQLRES